MKTTKVILVALIMAFATVGFAQSKTGPPTISAVPQITAIISLNTALNNHGLVEAMHAQLSPEFLQVEKPVYIVRVVYNRTVYNIFGTYAQWNRFFGISVINPIKKT